MLVTMFAVHRLTTITGFQPPIHFLFSRTFLNKEPSRVSRVVDEDIQFVPLPLFTIFVNFTMHFIIPNIITRFLLLLRPSVPGCWSLVSHHRSCLVCRNPFTGCILFDGVRIVVTSSDVYLSVSLSVFESAGYHHCSFMRQLSHSSRQALSFACLLVQYPPWLFLSEEMIKSHLDAVLPLLYSRVSDMFQVCVSSVALSPTSSPPFPTISSNCVRLSSRSLCPKYWVNLHQRTFRLNVIVFFSRCSLLSLKTFMGKLS